MAIDLGVIFTAVLASMGYGFFFYITNEFPDMGFDDIDINEVLKRFSYLKFLSTIIVGIVVGIISAATGDTVTPESFKVKMGIYGVYIVTVEKALKLVYRYLKNRGKRSLTQSTL